MKESRNILSKPKKAKKMKPFNKVASKKIKKPDMTSLASRIFK